MSRRNASPSPRRPASSSDGSGTVESCWSAVIARRSGRSRGDEFASHRRYYLASIEHTEAGREMRMGNVVVSQFMSLDGVIEDPGGVEGFDGGGWAFRYDRGAEGNKFKLDEILARYAHLCGRWT